MSRPYLNIVRTIWRIVRGVPPPLASHPRTAPYHHGDLAEALVGEALERLRRDGAGQVSLRAVAQAVGVSPSAAYHHFPDKDALLHEVAHRGGDLLDRRVETALGAVEGEGEAALVQRMRAIGEAYIDFAVDEPNLFRHTFGPLCAADAHSAPKHVLVGVTPGEPEDPPAAAPDGDHVYTRLTETLDAMDAAGMLRRREGVDLLAWTVVHGLAGLLVDGLLPPEARGLVLRTVLENVLADPSRLDELLAG
jgi:AcrR family transcriptional regulator